MVFSGSFREYGATSEQFSWFIFTGAECFFKPVGLTDNNVDIDWKDVISLLSFR